MRKTAPRRERQQNQLLERRRGTTGAASRQFNRNEWDLDAEGSLRGRQHQKEEYSMCGAGEVGTCVRSERQPRFCRRYLSTVLHV
ncbi:hypothetical protein BDU57DRAFT_305791 [Ampelomyces quisqualis]|uniref:Uncharacterized protein n=1 Tax=Ampelomyces quisqualis TaxID=50730 RepID=A0A6A5QGZ4_AMPQU|nr:hypothetical protein BDU57DRAFT_305791 [Ampelomyces quisqualis]